MSAIRALRQIATPLVARRTLYSSATAAVPRVAGMRVASLASSSSSSLSNLAATRNFASSATRLGQGARDFALSQKLQEELNYENETGGGASAEVPQFLKDFQEQGIWTIEDVAGQDEVTLHRKFGNENLRLIFSIADIQTSEDFAPEEEGEEDVEGVVYPIRASLSVTKTNGSGALNLDMIVQEGRFIIDNISFYDDAKLGTELTAEADWKRRGLYIGPQFDTLDVGVQDEFDQFLQEREVHDALAQFIPQYSEFKEQKEYVKWLGRVKSFVDL